MKYVCPECEEKSDTIRVVKSYSHREQWESSYDVDINGKETFYDRDDFDDVDGEGILDKTKYVCTECDFETKDIKDFKKVEK